MLSLLQYFLNEAAPGRLRQFLWLMAFIVLNGFVELVALTMLALFITSLSAPEQVMQSHYVGLAARILEPEILQDARAFCLALSVAAIIALILKNVLLAIQHYVASRFDGALNKDFGVKMLSGFLSQPYAESSGKNSSEVMQVISWKAHVGTLASSLCTVATDAAISLFMFATMLIIQPAMTLCIIGGLVFTGWASFRLLRGKALVIGNSILKLQFSITNLIMRTVQGLRDVTLFNAARESELLLQKDQDTLARSRAAQLSLERAPTWILETVGVGGLILGAIIMLTSTDVSTARMMGTLSLVAVAAWRILPAIYRSMAVLGTIRSYQPHLHRVREFVEKSKTHALRKAASQRSLTLLSSSIDLQGVRFRYKGAAQDALSDINVTIPRGSITGIIGPSGAGKSTLVDLLSGLLAPSQGQLLVDGILVDDSRQEAWMRQIGLVPQSPYLFEATLAQNIAYTLVPDAIDMDKVWNSCRQAGVAEFLPILPQGLETIIGERAGLLSGGQAQRVAIARALYRNPQVLLFDEATSSLDDANARFVLDTIRAQHGDKTVIIISHNMQSVMFCDTVFLLKQGRIIEQGPPEKIVQRYQESLHQQGQSK